MLLSNYGLLTGVLTAHGDQHGGTPDYLLTIQAGSTHYHVAVNLESTPGVDAAPELQFQIIPNLHKGNAKAKALAGSIHNQNRFVLAHSEGSPRLDYVHDGFLNMSRFKTIHRGTNPKNNVFHTKLVAAAKKTLKDPHTFFAVFGTGYAGTSSSVPARPSFRFTGTQNVHMNQSTYSHLLPLL